MAPRSSYLFLFFLLVVSLFAVLDVQRAHACVPLPVLWQWTLDLYTYLDSRR